jgi:hypothetical protein
MTEPKCYDGHSGHRTHNLQTDPSVPSPHGLPHSVVVEMLIGPGANPSLGAARDLVRIDVAHTAILALHPDPALVMAITVVACHCLPGSGTPLSYLGSRTRNPPRFGELLAWEAGGPCRRPRVGH